MMPNPKVNFKTFRFSIEGLHSGVLQNVGHTATQVRLAAGASAVDNFYNGQYLQLTAGPFAGLKPRLMLEYTGATKDAIVTPPYPAAPGGENYAVFLALRREWMEFDVAAATANTLTLADAQGASPKDGFYEDLFVQIIKGTGYPGRVTQTRVGKNYVGATRVLTIGEQDWSTVPDATSRCRIQGHLYFPIGGVDFKEDAGVDLIVGYQHGALAFGRGVPWDVHTHQRDLGDLGYVEIALEVDEPARFLNVFRSE